MSRVTDDSRWWRSRSATNCAQTGTNHRMPANKMTQRSVSLTDNGHPCPAQMPSDSRFHHAQHVTDSDTLYIEKKFILYFRNPESGGWRRGQLTLLHVKLLKHWSLEITEQSLRPESTIYVQKYNFMMTTTSTYLTVIYSKPLPMISAYMAINHRIEQYITSCALEGSWLFVPHRTHSAPPTFQRETWRFGEREGRGNSTLLVSDPEHHHHFRLQLEWRERSIKGCMPELDGQGSRPQTVLVEAHTRMDIMMSRQRPSIWKANSFTDKLNKYVVHRSFLEHSLVDLSWLIPHVLDDLFI
jgi:hypothetical protein